MEKYKSIIDEWKRFKDEQENEQTKAIRKNPLKAGKDFEEKLSEEVGDWEKSSWNNNVYRVECEKPGISMLHWRGEFYVQEESASIPVVSLDPKQGDKILDMCAAPGGKTTQMASRIENRGSIVANDESSNRLQSLQSNIFRTGSISAATTNRDGREISEDRKFDKVLVDAPCSGEGDRYRRKAGPARSEESENLSNLQEQLLKKAVRLTKNGGSIVYSTCTINPVENEKVVDSILETENVKLEETRPLENYQPGVTEFQEISFRDELEKTLRVLPHHLGSGVIFVAKLIKQ